MNGSFGNTQEETPAGAIVFRNPFDWKPTKGDRLKLKDGTLFIIRGVTPAGNYVTLRVNDRHPMFLDQVVVEGGIKSGDIEVLRDQRGLGGEIKKAHRATTP